MAEKKEVQFKPEAPTFSEACDYIQNTIVSGSLTCRVKWRFDEQQADSFHRSWTSERFESCIHSLMEQIKT